jgi:hypothetical protein
MALLNATLFCNPVTTTSTSLLSGAVPTPTVSAILGTASMSLLKKRALARIVSYARVLTRVREARDDPSRWDDQSNGGGRGGWEGPTRLVESDMPICANATQEQLDAAV